MWGIESLHNLSKAAKYKLLGRPLKLDMPPYVEAWKPGELVKPVKFPGNLRNESFYLGDFGQAVKYDKSNSSSSAVAQKGRPPLLYCSPDRLHKKAPSFACDMWSYTCLFAEMYMGYLPFTTWRNGGVITSMVETLGPLPEQWKGSCIDSEVSLDKWYDKNTRKLPDFSLAAKIRRGNSDSDPVEQQQMVSILTRGFDYNPETRITATQLLQDPSFKAIIGRYCR